jgi:TfoX/Sxy family transcriptional regulator of competence genes
MRNCPFILYIACVQCRGWLKQQNVSFLLGYGSVFDATRNNQEFAFFQPDMAISKLHAKPAFYHQEKFIFVIVVMPDEWSLELDELDLLAVQFPGDLGLPGFGETGQFFGKAYLLHLLLLRLGGLVERSGRYSIVEKKGYTLPIRGSQNMAFSEALAERIRKGLARRKGIEEKKMFGGIGFLFNGNMLLGVWKESLIVRLNPEEYDDALLEPHVKEFDITGRAMKGWLLVKPEGIEDNDELSGWIQRAIKFVGKLPAK